MLTQRKPRATRVDVVTHLADPWRDSSLDGAVHRREASQFGGGVCFDGGHTSSAEALLQTRTPPRITLDNQEDEGGQEGGSRQERQLVQRPGDVRAWHTAGTQEICRAVPLPLGTGAEEGSEDKGLPKHQAEGQRPCPGALGSYGRAGSRGGAGELWV